MKVANQGIEIDPRMLTSIGDICAYLSPEVVSDIESRDWYEVTLPNGKRILAIMDSSSDYAEEPFEGVDKIEEINYVDVPLRRYSKEDGFYHA